MKKLTVPLLIFIFLWHLTISFAQSNGDWKSIGPKDFPPQLVGQIAGIGRVSQIKFHPTDPNTIYAASANGGTFVSYNKGGNWTPFGSDFLPASGAACICLDYTSNLIAYLGTGDLSYYSNGLGIWKTTDGGVTWNRTSNGIENRLIVDILMSPTDHNVLIVATNDGIWKSLDGGSTWSQKLIGGEFTDIVFKPGTPTTMYGITRTDFWRSTDMGDTWTKIALPGTGLEGGGRIAVTPANANLVYITFVGNFDAGTSTPVLKSTNSGTSFSVVKAGGSPNMNGYSANEGGQGSYNYCLSASPTNPNLLFIAGHIMWKSTNGGASWTQIQEGWWGQVHTDMRQIPFSPYNSKEIYNINDGGIWKSTDEGNTWLPACYGLNNNEAHVGAVSPINKEVFSTGTQDNGSFVRWNGIWFNNGGGDNYDNMVFDRLSTNYYLNLTGNGGGRRNLPNGDNSSLNLPFDAGGDAKADFPPTNTNVGFVAFKDVYRTTNLSGNPPTWTKISSINANIKSIAVSPTDANVLYVVTSDGKVRRSDNALAASPSFTTYSTPSSASNEASIVVIKSNTNIVYMTCNNKVYRSTNKGAAWTDITANAPAENYQKILHDTYSTNEAVYLAGFNFVLYKDNTMTNWINYSNGLPSATRFFRIYINSDGTDNSVLTAITSGRSNWQTSLYGKQPILRVPENPSSTLTGIVYKYYEGTWDALPIFSSLTPVNTGATDIPNIGVRAREDNFGLVFDGYIDAPTDGKYTFYINSDDGSSLYFGDDMLIGNDGMHGDQEKSGYLWLKKGKHKFTLNYFNGAYEKSISLSWEGPGIAKQAIPTNYLYRLSPMAECPGNGSITVDRWNNITGATVADIPVGNTPSSTTTNKTFESYSDVGDNFGERYRGYICPPYNGNYTFLLYSDDDAELWLSTDGNPANKQRIAYLTGAVALRDFYSNASQKSAPIYLNAGQKYYVEALHKEDVGGDLFGVAWQMPSGDFQAPIAGKHLSPFVSNTAPTVSLTAPADNSAYIEGTNVTISANAADAGGTVSKVEFYLDDIKLAEDNASPYSYTWTSKAQTMPYTLSARATDNSGAVTVSAKRKFSVVKLRDPENPASTSAGLDYKYYEGTWDALPFFNILTPVKTGTVANYDISIRNREDNFGIVYTGFINVAQDGIYTFYAKTDDGCELYIGDQLIIINDGLHGNDNEITGVIGLKAGKHAITLDYFNGTGAKSIDISYSGPGVTKALIPNTAFFRSTNGGNIPPTVSITSPANNATFTPPASITLNANANDADGTVSKVEWYNGATKLGESTVAPYTYNWTNVAAGTYTITAKAYDNNSASTTSSPVTVNVSGSGTGDGLKGYYYNGMNFETPVLVRTDANVNFDWADGSPATGVNADGFSVRWKGQIQPRYTGTYTFYMTSDNGRRVWINNQLVIDKWIDDWDIEYSGTIALNAGQKYDIKIEYFENNGGANAKFEWSSASQAREVVPQSQLYSAIPTGDGLAATYYNGMNFETSVLTRIDPTVNFTWADASPGTGVNADGFSARWTGLVEPAYSGTYTFYVNSDNGRRLWVNNQLIIDKWIDDWGTEYSGTISLVAGFRYDIKLEYFENYGGASCQLSWSHPSRAKQIIPKAKLFSSSALKSAQESLSIGKPMDNNSFTLYPNPVSTILHIGELTSSAQLNVYNSQGEKVMSKFGKELDVTNLKQGMYFLRIIADGNKYVYKFIKK